MKFFLDDYPLEVDSPSSLTFSTGDPVCLSSISHDPTIACDWYNRGFTIQSFQHIVSFSDLLSAVESTVKSKLALLFPEKNLSLFAIERYHEYVSEIEHSQIADPCLKLLYVNDLPEIAALFSTFISELIGSTMGFERTNDGSEHWIILRINPPYSLAYNPPHKDIYEDFDSSGNCPRMVNAWIPIAGVNSLAGLGLAPSSHLLPESLILRSKAGAQMNGRRFSVNFIKSWDNSSTLLNIYPSQGEMLCFSSHLVHGLGINRNPNMTRVALEFRLHQSDN